jgi:hypothetical protein
LQKIQLDIHAIKENLLDYSTAVSILVQGVSIQVLPLEKEGLQHKA